MLTRSNLFLAGPKLAVACTYSCSCTCCGASGTLTVPMNGIIKCKICTLCNLPHHDCISDLLAGAEHTARRPKKGSTRADDNPTVGHARRRHVRRDENVAPWRPPRGHVIQAREQALLQGYVPRCAAAAGRRACVPHGRSAHSPVCTGWAGGGDDRRACVCPLRSLLRMILVWEPRD